MVGRGPSFAGLVPYADSGESVAGVNPCDSGAVIGYQADNFTCTWQMKHYVVQSEIYPKFTGNVSTVVVFPLETSCDYFSFVDTTVEELSMV